MNEFEIVLLLLILGVNVATMIVLLRKKDKEPTINMTQAKDLHSEGHKGWARLKG